ncbi:hypothetical protein FHT86_003526 [Rhizobium sp. BK313]|uniref:hypothetical protein n=1 Tax=Rhizobium sp. BK313 TaxID=2587081 RepID=UPI00105C68F4|nr:hypothetical protein [Rhizobium sp. BK313]MBB3455227.1 hypothetical protein [Rhizobium sp. BK313]
MQDVESLVAAIRRQAAPIFLRDDKGHMKGILTDLRELPEKDGIQSGQTILAAVTWLADLYAGASNGSNELQ